MTYTQATILPTLYFPQWGNLTAPNPTLSAPLLPSDTVAYFSNPILDHNGAKITGSVLIGVKNADSYVMTCYIAPGAISADGLSATVVQGIRLEGLDFTTSDPTLIPPEGFSAGDAVFCNISGVIQALTTGALRGIIATNGLGFVMGDGTNSNVTISQLDGSSTKGFLRKNPTTGKVQYSNDGASWVNFDSVSASNLVLNSNADTTPDYLNTKLVMGAGMHKSTVNPAGNETLSLSANGPLATMVTDVSSSAAQIDAAVALSATIAANNVPVGFYPGGGKVITGTLGDAVSGSDISNNLNLVYQLTSDGKWYKVTSSSATWYNKLGLVLESGIVGAAARVLLEGEYSNQTFANINPTFSSALTGSTLNVGDTAANAAQSFKVDNSTGAECIVTGGTISAKQQGTPSGPMEIDLVLTSGGAEQTGYPACFRDVTTGFVIRGAIIGTATIAQANFSGVFQNLAFSFGANIKIPAGSKVHLVISKQGGAFSGANYYQVQSNAATAVLNETTMTWSGTENAGNTVLTVTSTSPLGYSVKAYTGTNGSYGLTPSNAWSKVLGQIITTSKIYFSPNLTQNATIYTNLCVAANVATTQSVPIKTITTAFCPTSVRNSTAVGFSATTSYFTATKGSLRGDKSGSTTNTFYGPTTGLGGNQSANMLGGTYSSGTLNVEVQQFPVGVTAANGAGTLNGLNCVRLETGAYLYISYPTGAGYISNSAAGYSATTLTSELVMEA